MIKIGIIIQARMQSTRLPKKVTLDFYNGKNILEFLTDNLISKTDLPVVVATSTEKADDRIVEICNKNDYNFYRGSENDVLDRFIGAAEEYGFTHVIRVCSDNPFIIPKYVQQLAETAFKNPEKDYIGFDVNGTPSILTHYGLWAELAKVEALKSSFFDTENSFHEHVTYDLYQNPDKYSLLWLNVDDELVENKNIRLTIDEDQDFKNAKRILEDLGSDFNEKEIIQYLKSSSELIESMKNMIEKNSKS